MGTYARSRADFWRVQDIDAFWNKPHPSLSEQDLQEVVGEVLRAAQMLLESDTELLAEGTIDFATAKTALSTVWRRTGEALRGNVLSAEALIDASEFGAHEPARVSHELPVAEMQSANHAGAGPDDVLDRLRGLEANPLFVDDPLEVK